MTHEQTIGLFKDKCKHPRKYDHVIGVPSWYDAASTLLNLGYKLPQSQLPLGLKTKK